MPVAVAGLSSGVVDIALGSAHTCALTASGAVKCWGNNYYGQLGLGTEGGPFGTDQSRNQPADVVGLSSGVVAIGAGGDRSCALLGTGAVKCWGYYYSYVGRYLNGYRQTTPQDISGLPSDITGIAVSSTHSCARTSAGAVKCWADDPEPALGGFFTSSQFGPAYDVPGWSAGVSAIAAGPRYSCALTSAGGVQCRRTRCSTCTEPTPSDVAGLESGIAALSTGGSHLCVVTTAGGAKCRGEGRSGQLGDGNETPDAIGSNGLSTRAPVDVVGMSSGVTQISAGSSHTCAIAGGAAKCWGWDATWQLGDNHLVDIPFAERTGMPPDAVATIDGGGAGSVGLDTSPATFSCVLTTAGAVKCAGWNREGQLGDGSNLMRGSLVDVVGLGSGVVALSTTYGHSCALLSSGTVKCWGLNSSSELGDGTTQDRNTPVDVSGLSGVVAISGSCALTNAGTVKCWGGPLARRLRTCRQAAAPSRRSRVAVSRATYAR